ncbi:MAG TPA: chromosome segregation protein SMC [Firmicutes bacterium]|nr:chromosome segregation protein SMC [Bacillota bacterium]
MRLKSMEITGFKSFPEREKLRFPRGITAIVGPNGCGKSNLADAIRWVLGEQSAKSMRGAKMEELMFSGTAQRRALNFAEVSLTLDNAEGRLPLEYHEVVITRRMYRSGEGEYYLNKTPCRLRDIHELFWDTGIGTETYSFVGQGRVEQIINARPEDRRELFEEAAEIYKYKQQKKMASSRLEELKVNMVRLGDLLAELRGRQGSLLDEAKQARVYLDLQAQHQKRERKLFEFRWEKSRKSLARIKDESVRLEDLMQIKKTEWQNISIDLEHLIQDEKDLSLRLEKKQEIVLGLRARIEELNHKKSLVKEQKKFAREKSILKEEASRELRLRLEGLETTIAKNKKELQDVLKEQEAGGQEAARVQERLGVLRKGSHAVSREKLKEQLAGLRSHQAVLEHTARDNKLRLGELGEKIAELEKRREIKGQEIEKLNNEEERIEGAFARLENEQKDQQKELQWHQKRYRVFSCRLDEQKEKLIRSAHEIERKKDRLRLLQENEGELLSYAAGVRAVMNAAAKGSLQQGIYGPVASLIDVGEEFEKAAEVALGASQQFIIVEDDRTARGAIAYLKEKKAGRATFLPLNLLKIPRPREIPKAGEDLLGIFSKIVVVEDRFKRAIDYLLGGVLVTKDLKTALQVLRQDKRGWRIVTLDGEMVTPGGTISGGLQPGKRFSFLQRKRELVTLRGEIEYLGKCLEGENKLLADDNEKLASLAEELSLLAARRETKEKEIIEMGKLQERCRLASERIADELKDLEKEIASARSRYNLLEEQGKGVFHGLEENRKTWGQIEKELSRTRQQVDQKESEKKKLEEELQEIRIRFSALQERESYLQGILKRQLQEKAGLETLAETLSAEEEKARAKVKELETEESNLARVLGEGKIDLEREEKILSQISRDHVSLNRAREEQGIKKEKEQRALERAERRYYQANLEKTRLEEESRYLKEHYLEKYGAELLEVPGPKVNVDEKQLRAERDRLAEQMLAFGDINIGAIDECARLDKRIQFLEDQLEDLLQGEKGTRQVMRKLDREMEKRFLETLRTVEKFFLHTFTGLFGGGQAFLKLADPEEVLESGIEIIAQPPGKKLQNISLLSGGEKALTSIALLFSLLQYKPVPFCVLDEIDSSLDESNIERFTDLLERFTDDTQFILITHRRKTMDAADVLYGVTMEEQGVSKILSLNLTKKVG